MKTKKIIVLLVTSIIFSACNKTKTSNSADSNYNSDIYNYKTKYVGDNSKIINILSSLKYPEGLKYNSVEIESNKEPYGLIVKMDINFEKIDDKNKFIENGAILFSLVENLSWVKFVNIQNNEVIIELKRNEVDEYLSKSGNKKTNEIGKDKTEFKKYIDYLNGQ